VAIMNAGELLDLVDELAQTVRVEAEQRSARGALVWEGLGKLYVRFIREAPLGQVDQIQVLVDLRAVCEQSNPRGALDRYLGPLIAALDGALRVDLGDRYPRGSWVEHKLDRMGGCERCGERWTPEQGAVLVAVALPGPNWQRGSDWSGRRPAALAVPCFPRVPEHRLLLS
jgi:hypothetical protein